MIVPYGDRDDPNIGIGEGVPYTNQDETLYIIYKKVGIIFNTDKPFDIPVKSCEYTYVFSSLVNPEIDQPVLVWLTLEKIGIANMGPETTEAEKACQAAPQALKVHPIWKKERTSEKVRRVVDRFHFWDPHWIWFVSSFFQFNIVIWG